MTKITMQMVRDVVKEKKLTIINKKCRQIPSNEYYVWPITALAGVAGPCADVRYNHREIVRKKFGLSYVDGFNLGFDGFSKKEALAFVTEKNKPYVLAGWIAGRRIKRFL